MVLFFQLCDTCHKPLVNKRNLNILRSLVVGVLVAGGAGLGAVALPLLGFASSGVVAGSLAAAWQSSIGNVAVGSLFATLQSLGTSVCSTILFGSFGGVSVALATLKLHASSLGFCTCDNES
jgi:hypothetical protein